MLEARTAGLQPEPAPGDAQATSPYPGLRPFSESDARLFFGREQETVALLKILETQQLVVVHGASGCGKSSLVRAGLLPVFRMDAAANSKRGRVVIVRPADEGGPLQSLARKLDAELELAAISDGEEEEIELNTWSTLLTTSPDWAKDIGERVDAAGGSLCIIFDQFEEIFAAKKVYAAQVQRLIDFLNSLSEPSPEGTALGGRAISVVVTMRSDYLGNCAIWEGFAETVNRCQYLLPRIGTLGLLRAIHEPARLAGGTVDDQIAERLLSVVKSELDGLPILQHALSRAWYFSTLTRGSRNIDVSAMEAVGGADSALSDHADAVFSAATRRDHDLKNIADCVLRSLSDLDTDGRIIRRSIPFEQLRRETGEKAQTLEAVLEPFRNPRNSLIMPPESEELHDKTIISVSHEALLRQWKRVSDTAFEDQRAAGLAYREAQDGMIWRALSVQAQQFAKDHKSILGPAATEQRLPWYREVSQRPGWTARHEMQAWSSTEAEVELHWQQVADFMKASESNLKSEQQKLHRERKLVASLRRTQRKLWWLQAAVIFLALVAMLGGFLYWRQQLAAKERESSLKVQRIQADSVAAALRSSFWMAQRYCAGRSLEGDPLQKCLVDQTNFYQQEFQTNEPNPKDVRLPTSSLGGGFGELPTAKGDSR